ncbi:UNVERIFIED_CONTAM: LINE-1 reverse transcriptase [Sesamum radiatum]|uniref:LINE-1 reverse transcriptase n=1 Tax=Sesamum radiatum TaxID=300843 RepID=A0AAW2JJP6_SESRA
MLVLKENRSPGPTRESGEDLTEFSIPRSGLRPSTSLELRTYQEGYQTITLFALKRLKLKTRIIFVMWLHHHSFLQTVRQSWELPIEGYGMYKLQQKLYRTKELLKKWNRETFGNVFSTAQQAKREATDAEKKFDRDPSEANLIALNKSNAVMVQALTMEAEYWRQKSNCKWLEAGERNTKYFHSLVKKKRIKSTIHRIMEGNQEITHPDRIRDSAASYFENLLSGQGAQPNTTDFPFQFSKISEAIGNNLCSIPSEEDIKETVFSIDKDSVAGPDGFSSPFYQACWDFIARIYMMQFGISLAALLCQGASQRLQLCLSRRWTPLRLGTTSDPFRSVMSPTKSYPNFSTEGSHKPSRN